VAASKACCTCPAVHTILGKAIGDYEAVVTEAETKEVYAWTSAHKESKSYFSAHNIAKLAVASHKKLSEQLNVDAEGDFGNGFAECERFFFVLTACQVKHRDLTPKETNRTPLLASCQKVLQDKGLPFALMKHLGQKPPDVDGSVSALLDQC
jgi:hypothetical protein